jgi:uncharacterized repeat protein (TIGR04076 family)
MPTYKIRCEVINIAGDKITCPGATRMKAGNAFVIGIMTPNAMCARSYAAVFPVALAMRHSEQTPWERGRGYIDVTCPDGHVVWRLTRIKTEAGIENKSE